MGLDREEPTVKAATLLKKLEEFDTYIRNNAGVYPELRGAAAVWEDHLYSACGIDRQPGGE